MERSPTTKTPKIRGFAAGRLALGLLLAGLLLLAACAPDAPQDALRPEGPIARLEDRLWDLTFGVAVAIFFLVEGALLFAVIKFRQRSPRESPVQVHHNTKLEIAWTVAPFLLLAALAVPTVAAIFDLARKPSGEVLDVEVIAHQWWWEYKYPDLGVVTANEMHIPAGKPVFLTLRSEDVIHSFWVPRLAGKQDVVPGRVNNLAIQADRPGEYFGQCAEFCGLSHANMRLRVFAHTADDFDVWVADQRRTALPALGLAAEGERLFLEGQCAGCHTINGTTAAGTVGPNLTHFAGRTTFAAAMFDRNRENLTRWLRDAPALKPGAKMPSGVRQMGLSENDILALIAYLETLT